MFAPLAGTPAQVLPEVKKAIQEGVDEVAIIPFGRDRRAVIQDFAPHVISRVR